MAATVAASVVQSRLDYANALLYGTPASNVHKLQCAQNSLSRVVLLTYKSPLSTNQPPYLRNLLHMYQPMRCLRSTSQNLLSVPFCTTNFGKRSFSFSAPTIWNELPADCVGSQPTSTKNSSHLSNHPQRITTSARPATARASNSTCSTAARVTSFHHSFIHTYVIDDTCAHR